MRRDWSGFPIRNFYESSPQYELLAKALKQELPGA